MKRWHKISLIVIGVLVVVVFVGLAIVTRSQAIDTVTHPPNERPKLIEDPGDFGLEFEYVTVTNEDGFKLYGWFVPGENGATVIAQHGTPGGRQKPHPQRPGAASQR